MMCVAHLLSVLFWLCVLSTVFDTTEGGRTNGRHRRHKGLQGYIRDVGSDLEDWVDLSRWRTSSRSRSQPKPAEEPSSGQRIRLVNYHKHHNWGVVSVYRVGTWGHVCDDRWDILDATVACRQLGFTRGAVSASVNSSLSGAERAAGKILMDEVRCEGSEPGLQQCRYSPTHDCSLQEAATVVCRESPGCPDEWYPGLGKCYGLFSHAESVMLGAAICSMEGGRLLTIESKEENHFLSNLLTNVAPAYLHQWHIGATVRKGKWYWHKLVEEIPRSSRPIRQFRRKSRFKVVRSLVREEMWFPGWPSHRNQYAEPTNNRRKRCLTLSNQYTDPNGGNRNLDYFFWKADYCGKKTGVNFICEKDLPVETSDECYRGDGSGYSGEVGETQLGTPCLSWADSPTINNRTHPDKGLGDHTFCRNPDADSKPWCWVDHAKRKMGYCKIPQCSTGSVAAVTTPSPPEITECPMDEFFCPQQKICIPGSFKCDTENDCRSGADEEDCDYALSQFSSTPNKGFALSDQHSAGSSGSEESSEPSLDSESVSWFETTNEMCAKRCLSTTRFVCRSFVFTAENQTCLLHRHNSLHGRLFQARGSTFYERDSQRNCTGKFQCKNLFCVDLNKTCDGNNDCNDMSDELSCDEGETEPEASVRLVDGDEHSGTVEITYMGSTGVICDDGWGIEEATVVCRMLGYRAAENFSTVNHFRYPANKAEFLLDDVECTGKEVSIGECPAAPFKTHNCRAYEIAGVECQISKVCEMDQFKCSDEMCVKAKYVCDGVSHCQDGSDEHDCGGYAVELVNGTTWWEGRVQVTVAGLSGSVCDDMWDKHDAAVVCRSLGLNFGGLAISGAAFGQGSGPVWMDNVQCWGGEHTLDKCPHRGWALHDCDHSEDAGVRCFTSPLATAIEQTPTTRVPATATTTTTLATTRKATLKPTTTKKPNVGSSSVIVQLVDGYSEHEGNVALVISGRSYRVCDDGWDDAEARVVCRYLGYINGGIATNKSLFGTGDHEIILDDVQCSGSERSLEECTKNFGTSSHDCSNDEFAGVICAENPETAEPEDTPVRNFGFCGHRPYDTIDLLLERKRRSPITDGLWERTGPSTPAKISSDRKFEPKPNKHKVVGGNLVAHGKIPWQIGIRLVKSRRPDGSFFTKHHCGGTIISEHWVLSAAHCFYEKRKSEILLVAGDHNNQELDRGEQVFQVEEMILHENYSKASTDYDIALLKVKRRDGQGIEFTSYTQPACLPSATTDYTVGAKCQISGWGSEKRDGVKRYPEVLRAVDVPLLGRQTCQELYDPRFTGLFTQRMMCAGYLSGGVADTCHGDSGGPLVCEVEGAYTLIGITSWGDGCSQPNAPGVYSLVQNYLPWINRTLEEHSYSTNEGALPPRPRSG